jgi:hypothetical protein
MSIVCYAHAQAPTVATCSDCSRGLCGFCDGLVRPPLCAECLEQRAYAMRSRIMGRALNAVFLAILVCACVNLAGRFSSHQNIWPSIAAGYLALSAFYCADAVRRHIPPDLALLPFIGRAIYQAAWWATAAVVGTFILPFLASKTLVEAQRIKQLSAMVQKRLHPPTPPRILSVRVES